RWSTLNYAKLADMILEKHDVKVVFTWGPGELEIVNEIVSCMKRKALVSCKTTIKQLIELLRRSNIYIGGDTGPLHIASTLCIPTVAIFGPKDPILYGPYHDNTITINKDLPCSPCRDRTCSDPECLTTILPEEVFQAVNQLMDNTLIHKTFN
ncbi:MAG: glycosyltransferase family 9 protein, partial [Candidatus Brocadiales bacterium]|nr:glycosyltransferase family 9 protein [Candidatus Brocadiales bacterium]